MSHEDATGQLYGGCLDLGSAVHGGGGVSLSMYQQLLIHTVCLRSLNLFYIASYRGFVPKLMILLVVTILKVLLIVLLF